MTSVADGVNVAVVPAPFRLTVPETLVLAPLARKVKVEVVTLVTASLKVAVTAVPGLTFVALFAGAVELTVGGVVSEGAETVISKEEALTSPCGGLAAVPESTEFPNHAAAYVWEPGVDGAGVVKVIGKAGPPPMPLAPEFRATSTLSRYRRARIQPDWLPPVKVTVIVSPGAYVVLFGVARRLLGPWWWHPLQVGVFASWHRTHCLST